MAGSLAVEHLNILVRYLPVRAEELRVIAFHARGAGSIPAPPRQLRIRNGFSESYLKLLLGVGLLGWLFDNLRRKSLVRSSPTRAEELRVIVGLVGSTPIPPPPNDLGVKK